MDRRRDLFRMIPKVDRILEDKRIQGLLKKFPRDIVVEHIRQKLGELRAQVSQLNDDKIEKFENQYHQLIINIVQEVEKLETMSLKPVINATGVVLHTNLGRAVLANTVKEQLCRIAGNYSTLELDIDTGERGSRYSHVEKLLVYLTKAESALVTNNNAAAVLLVLGTLAKNKEVIVSRGELVEIGGSFRIPDIMSQSGAKLVEVGTTNKTYLSDYEKAITENTGVLLKVHTSNYKVVGFTHDVELKDLVELGRKYHIPVVQDLGSGIFIDLSKYGLIKEPIVNESILQGADVVTFSGDKLLGGPQAGIIIGKGQYIDLMKKNPLLRAFRIDKLTLAALEATLRLYLFENEEDIIKNIPTLRMLTFSADEIQEKADTLYQMLKENVEDDCMIKMFEGFSQVGGGAMPLLSLPTILLGLRANRLPTYQLEKILRKQAIPIITRIYDDQIIIDVRTVKKEEFPILVEQMKKALNMEKGEEEHK